MIPNVAYLADTDTIPQIHFTLSAHKRPLKNSQTDRFLEHLHLPFNF